MLSMALLFMDPFFFIFNMYVVMWNSVINIYVNQPTWMNILN
jgi:hypothetical protein